MYDLSSHIFMQVWTCLFLAFIFTVGAFDFMRRYLKPPTITSSTPATTDKFNNRIQFCYYPLRVILNQGYIY